MQRKDQLYPDFVRLIQEHEKLIHKVCSFYADEAEQKKDLFQEIVLQTWLAYPKFKNRSKFSTWLYRVALNTAINFKRKETKHISVSDESLQHLSVAESMFTEEQKVLYQIIYALPALEKALMLLYLEGRNHQEIAEILGLSLSNVGTKIGRLKAKIKNEVTTIFK